MDLAWAEGNIGLAQEHADRAFSIALKSGNPYLRVYAQACRGLSHIVAGRLTSAIEDLSDALSFARSRKAGLENEPRILADLANAYRLNGEIRRLPSPRLMRQSRLRPSVMPVFLNASPVLFAQICCSDLTTSDQKAEGRQELERARALMRETGAILFKSFFTTVEYGDTRQVSIKAR